MKNIFYTFLLISPLLFISSCEEEEESQSDTNIVGTTWVCQNSPWPLEIPMLIFNTQNTVQHWWNVEGNIELGSSDDFTYTLVNNTIYFIDNSFEFSNEEISYTGAIDGNELTISVSVDYPSAEELDGLIYSRE